MKKTTCKDLGGTCEAQILGATADEMGQNCKSHVMEMIQAGDAEHQAAMEQWQKMSKEDFDKWFEDFKNRFESLENA